jgi:hypothetical protein
MESKLNISPDRLVSDTGIETAQNGLVCLSKAWTVMAHGMMAAGTAEIDLARSLCAATVADLPKMTEPHSMPEAMGHMMQSAKSKYDHAIGAQRRANDAFAEAMFSAWSLLATNFPMGYKNGMTTRAGLEQSGKSPSPPSV